MDMPMTDFDAEELRRQAWMTADDYLHQAVVCINDWLGEGYAQSHPELIGAFLLASATAFTAGALNSSIDKLTATLDRLIESQDGPKEVDNGQDI
jgi:hypothetical protein